MRLVKAKEMGFYNGSRVRPGAVIQVPDEFAARWVEDVTPVAPPVVEKKVARKVRENPAPDFGTDLA